MEPIIIFVIASIIILVAVVIIQQGRIVIANRMRYEQSRQIGKEREATAAILGLSAEAMNSDDTREEIFLARFIEYSVRALQGTGAAVMTVQDDGSLKGCSVTGTFPPIKDVTPQVAQQLLAHPKKHSELIRDIHIPLTINDVTEWCRKEKFAFFKNTAPPNFPPNFKQLAPRMIVCPVKIRHQPIAVVIVVSGDEFDAHSLVEDDGAYLVRLNEIATLSLEAIKMFQEREEYQERLQNAREEGMLQVSTGIIHNIGNAVTVAKLNVLDLKEKFPAGEDSPENLIIHEIMPNIEKHLAHGELQRFMTDDPVGSQYPVIIKELLEHIRTGREQARESLNNMSNKLYHISEIIELQQRFVGELGTENLASLATVMQSSIKIFEETCNKRGVDIRTKINNNVPEVVIDTSMMTQVFMNLIKNAVEAMESDNREEKQYQLNLAVYEEKREDQNYVVAEIRDNGPGIPEELREKIFEFGFSTKSEDKASRGYGLHSCRDTVKKYDGILELESEVGQGTSFKIILPVGENNS